MEILVLGGTVFLGRHVVAAALARGHTVTLFNRGLHNAELFPGLERLRGDRNGDVHALAGRRFDAVIDLSGYAPPHMTHVARALGEHIEHYVFVSTVSVYESFAPWLVFTEEAALASGTAGYGPLKARAEETIQALYPDRVTHVRPGLIVGPHDPTERFTYWPRRFARAAQEGTERGARAVVLAPGRAERPIQYIDARDLAGWCVELCLTRKAGYFNATTPAGATTMGQLINACNQASSASASVHWIDDATLVRESVQAWTELPVWIPETDDAFGGMMLADSHQAMDAGLTFRPLDDTVRATLEWSQMNPIAGQTNPTNERMRAKTLSPERENALIFAHT